MPRTRSWNPSAFDHILHTSSEHEVVEFVSPIMQGIIPHALMTVNSRADLITEKKRFLKSKYATTEEYITSRKPLELASETLPIVKVQSVATVGFTSTTYATPLEDIADPLVTKISENLFTPEVLRSDEYSSLEKIANNTSTITVSREALEDKSSNELYSLEEKVEISKNIHQKGELHSQITMFKEKLSQHQTPSYDLKLTQDQISSDEQKPPQDQKTLKGKKPSQDRKPLREDKMSVSHLKVTLQSNTRLETSQERSQETLSEETSPPKTPAPLLSLTDMSSSEMLPLKKSPSEIESHEKLPRNKHANEEDSEEKYFYDEKSLEDDVSESESSAISIEIEAEMKPTKKLLRFQNTTNVGALQEETLVTLTSKTTYPTDDLFSDSELIDPQLSLAPSLAEKIKKQNQTDLDKTILTLLYLSDNDKDNVMNGIMGHTQSYATNAESELTSEEDRSIKPKRKKNGTFKSTNVKKDSNKLTANDEFSSNILFDILKEAVDNGMFKNELNKRMNKLKKKA